MSDGIIYIVFGKEYERMALRTILLSRRHTRLPFFVITNISNRQPQWNQISGIRFLTFPKMSQDENRWIKISLVSYTPFDRTLYLDADSVIQREGIESVFELLEQSDMAMNRCLQWNPGDRVLVLYYRHMKRHGVKLPLFVWNGAAIAFKRNQTVQKFFGKWREYWKVERGREMPALACAVVKSRVNVCAFPKGILASDIYDSQSIIQHNYNSQGDMDWWDFFQVPRIRQHKPFDGPDSQSDWRWISS